MAAGKTLQQLLDEARRRIEVSDEELAEARRRRGLLEAALRDEFPGCRVYLNGSVAHGDALTPLTDVDIGGVAFGDDDPYGPGKEGPSDPMERARGAIKGHLGEEFPRLRVVIEGQRRAVLVSFGDPVTPSTDDFTADVIIGVDNEGEVGIFIPNLPDDDWDASAPEEHTALVQAANKRTERVYARAIRLLKHWNRHHGEPVCSWLLKVLGLPSITGPMPLARALQAFFRHATTALRAGPVGDPLRVSDPIQPNLPLEQVLDRFDAALRLIDEAIAAEDEGRPFAAQHALTRLFPEIVPDASADDLRREEAARLAADARRGMSTGIGSAASMALPTTRAWGGMR